MFTVAAPYGRPHPPDHHFSQLRSIPIPVILTAQILTSPAIPTPSRFTSPKTQQQLSRPLENCAGCPALAGVRNLGLDDPSAGVQIYIAISASAAAGPRRAAAARRAESLKRGCTGRTVRRAEWQVLAECVARGASMHPINQNVRAPCNQLARRPDATLLASLAGRQAVPPYAATSTVSQAAGQAASKLRETHRRENWKSTLAAPRC